MGHPDLNTGFLELRLYAGDKADRRKAKALLYYSLSQETKEKLRHLSSIKWIHGSSTAALAMMLHMNPDAPTLVHTGALLNAGISPFYGEKGRGCDPWGINQRALSAETIRNISRILGYTKMNPFNPTLLTTLGNHPLYNILNGWGRNEFATFCIWSEQD